MVEIFSRFLADKNTSTDHFVSSDSNFSVIYIGSKKCIW